MGNNCGNCQACQAKNTSEVETKVEIDRQDDKAKFYENEEFVNSVTKIQANFRGFSVRNKLKEDEPEKIQKFELDNGSVYEGTVLGNISLLSTSENATPIKEGDTLRAKENSFTKTAQPMKVCEWVNYKANGKGQAFIKEKGLILEGDWKDDKLDGRGKEKWPDGSYYEGNYSNGLKNGHGTFVWPDGSQYIGEWKGDKKNGYGNYIWCDNKRYEGSYLNDNMHGKGILKWPDGRRYEGEFKNDLKDGFGEYIFADKKKYVGEWKAGVQHGSGTIIYPDGKSRSGVWEDGKRIKWLSEYK